MSAAVGCGSVSGSWAQVKDRINLGNRNCRNKNGFKVSCVLSSSAVSDSYRTLRIRPGASESEVKKAFRKLALQKFG
ncbi:Chaperone protein dnaJ 8- chloroplastic [Striga hermonthica]|uniref:Chaperone protein dnaJ 8- chloroplastic n=1 Tax=Striga hermonthica TaxID=68872 RepID=A0A9N7MW42_STRHE|nr:Chaperone protein dnaJ 8- chloroplastic [Striga hermonthica]